MLIPHLHFCGDCKAAIALYEKAFDTKVEEYVTFDDYSRNDPESCANDKQIAHARMIIHGQALMLNDRDDFDNKDKSLNSAPHLIVQFASKEELLACYEHFKDNGRIIDPFVTTFYSALVGNFMDEFGVLWGFMVV